MTDEVGSDDIYEGLERVLVKHLSGVSMQNAIPARLSFEMTHIWSDQVYRVFLCGFTKIRVPIKVCNGFA